jgi:hypothetical protein
VQAIKNSRPEFVFKRGKAMFTLDTKKSESNYYQLFNDFSAILNEHSSKEAMDVVAANKLTFVKPDFFSFS